MSEIHQQRFNELLTKRSTNLTDCHDAGDLAKSLMSLDAEYQLYPADVLKDFTDAWKEQFPWLTQSHLLQCMNFTESFGREESGRFQHATLSHWRVLHPVKGAGRRRGLMILCENGRLSCAKLREFVRSYGFAHDVDLPVENSEAVFDLCRFNSFACSALTIADKLLREPTAAQSRTLQTRNDLRRLLSDSVSTLHNMLAKTGPIRPDLLRPEIDLSETDAA